jgi:predicted TIM-barrel fold metal-dependent hydrolase
VSDPDFQFIDAHHHLWDLQALTYPWLMSRGQKRFFGDPTPIQRNYLPGDFLTESSRYRPNKSVHIQVGVAAGDEFAETRWLQTQEQIPNAIVAFADLSAGDLGDKLAQHGQCDRLRGIRQIIGRHPVEDLQHGTGALLDCPQWLDGLRTLAEENLSFDLQLIPPQMERAATVLAQVPELKVALCHCGSPWDQSPEGIQHWRRGLQRLAQLPNVYCKVSGLGMFNPGWQTKDLRPLIHDVIEIFGPARVMFGSNFPVDKLYRTYETLWQAYEDITVDYTVSEREQMYSQTAQRFYRI